MVSRINYDWIGKIKQAWTEAWTASDNDIKDGVIRGGPVHEFTRGRGQSQLVLVSPITDGSDADTSTAMMARRVADTKLMLNAPKMAIACATVVSRYDSATTDCWVRMREDPPDVALCRALLDSIGWKWK